MLFHCYSFAVPSVKDVKAEVQNTEQTPNSDVSGPSSRDQSIQTEMSKMKNDQISMVSEFELNCFNDVLDIHDGMLYLFSEPEDTDCVSPSQSNTSIRSFMKRLKKSTSARLAHKARKIIHRVARSILTSPWLRRRS